MGLQCLLLNCAPKFVSAVVAYADVFRKPIRCTGDRVPLAHDCLRITKLTVMISYHGCLTIVVIGALALGVEVNSNDVSALELVQMI